MAPAHDSESRTTDSYPLSCRSSELKYSDTMSLSLVWFRANTNSLELAMSIK